MATGTFVEWAILGADLLIAAAIYWEIEEQRAATFLHDVQETSWYKGRALLYDAYARLPGPTLKDRAEQFRKALWESEDLRNLCDSQWMYFQRLRFMLRRSPFHRKLLAKWFPGVLVSLWVMTALYLREKQLLSPTPIVDVGLKAVREALQELQSHGLKPRTIYSKDKLHTVVIAETDLRLMLQELDGPFR